MSCHALKAALVASLLACVLNAYAATEVLPLNYRTSADLLPIAQNYLGNDGRASAYGNQLIVDAPPDKIAGLKDLLSQLDTQPKRLLISVDTSDSASQGDSGYSVNGSVDAGNTRIQTGSGNQTRIISRSTSSRTGGVQQVQASEGYPALIQVGQSVPLTNVGSDAYGRPQADTQYRDVTQGFYVTASVSGEIVHLAISTNNDRVSQSRPDVVNLQSASTQVSGRLGEWIQLGGVSQHRQSNQGGYTREYSTQGSDDMSLRVKVDLLE